MLRRGKPWSWHRPNGETPKTVAFYSHMDALLSRLEEWPDLIQSSLSLHPATPQGFQDAAESALVDLRSAVSTFHAMLLQADAGFSNAGYGLSECRNGAKGDLTCEPRPSLRSQKTLLTINDVMKPPDAEQWKRDRAQTGESMEDMGQEIGDLDLRDKNWRKCCPEGILNPQASFRRRWDNVVGLLVMADVLIVPFQLGYMSTVPVTFFMCLWPWILTVFFTVDIVLNLQTGFAAGPSDNQRSEMQMLVTDRAKIANRYIFSRAFLLDLVTTIPWSQLMVHIHIWTVDWEQHAMAAMVLVRLVRMLRLQKLLLVWERVEEGASSMLQLHMFVLLRTLVIIFLFCHLNACMWFTVGRQNHVLTMLLPSPMREHFNELPHWTTVERNGGPTGHWTWMEEPMFNQYAFSFYWTLGVMRTMPSEVLPANVYERVYVMLLMFAAFSLFAISVAQVTQTFTKFTERKRTFNEELLALQLYMDTIGAPKTLQEDVVNYSKHLFDHRRVNAKETGLMARLPKSLTKDLHYAHVESYIRRLATFNNWSQRALRKVSALSEVKHISRGTVLSQRGQTAAGVWIVMAGNLEVFRHHADTVNSPTPVIEAVDEDCLATNEPVKSALTIISTASAEVLFISKGRFFELIESLDEEGYYSSKKDGDRLETPGVPDPLDRQDPEQPLLPLCYNGQRQ